MPSSESSRPAHAGGPGPGASRAIVHCDALLIDMDGTLVDSRQLVERMWLVWAAEHGIPPDAVLAVAHGRRTLETMELVAPELATPEEAARLDALEAEQEGGETAIPGALALLNALPPERWAVVTSASRSLAIARLAIVGLPAPRVLVCAEDVIRGKPAPDGYLLAARQLGISPHDSVVIEDTPAGIQAGHLAGAPVIGVRTTYESLEGCEWTVADLRAVAVERAPGARALRLSVETS
ncbi:MAG: HAD-IA family hydrolase [Vicinamibacterales bacterium]